VRARRLLTLAAASLLLPGCIALFGVEGNGLPRRIEKLEKRIRELEERRGIAVAGDQDPCTECTLSEDATQELILEPSRVEFRR